MYLHGIKEPQIFEYDTLTSEDHWNEYSDVILANPPFMSPKGGIRPHKWFSVQSNRSEVLFVDYIAEHLTPNGRAAVIVPEGVIFQSGKAYKQLRKMLVDNYLVGVISLPAGVFNPYSGVKTSILWLDKSLAKKTDKILFVKINNDGFDLGAQRRAIKQNDLPGALQKILDYKNQIISGKLADFEAETNISLVTRNDISGNGDYNLSGERYRNMNTLSRYELVNLNDICEFEYGYTVSAKDIGNTRFVRITDIDKNGTISEKDKKFIELNEENKKYLLSKGDIIIARTSATFGKTAIYERNEPTIFASFLIRIRVNPKLLIPKYLWSLTWSDKYWEQAQRLVTGGGQPQFNANAIKQIQIPLHPLPIQKEIVAEIESYQKIIDGARQVVENYKPRIDIDPEWEMVELGKVCKLTYGYTDTALDEGDIRFIRITDISGKGELRDFDLKFINRNKETSKYILKRGDLVVARTGATYGKTLYYNLDEPAVYASFLIKLDFNATQIDPLFYWIFTLSDNYDQQKSRLVTGGGQPQFNANVLKMIVIPVPALVIQKEIISKYQKESQLVKSSEKLITIFEQKIKDRIAKVWGE